MNTSTLARRWVATIAATTLIACIAAGCALLPGADTAEVAVPTLDIASSGIEERDALILAIQSAAAIITGDQVEPSKDFAVHCDSGEGTRFWYQVMVEDNGDSGATLARISTYWGELGIATVAKNEEGQVGPWVEASEPGVGPVGETSAGYWNASEQQDAFYMISGFSNCVAGEPESFMSLTGQTMVPGR